MISTHVLDDKMLMYFHVDAEIFDDDDIPATTANTISATSDHNQNHSNNDTTLSE